MPPNPPVNDKNGFIKGLSQLGLASWIALPSSDWQVNNLVDSGTFDFLGIINHHNSQMSKSVLAQWFDDDQGGGDGETSLVDFGKQSDATFMMMLDSILEDMAQFIDNQIFPRFIDWNFGSGLYPHFKWGQLSAEQKAAVQETFTQLAAAGQTANVTPDFMLELEQKMAEELGLDVDYDQIKADREKQQKLMEQQYGEGQVNVGPDGTPMPLQPPGTEQGQGGPPQGGPPAQGAQQGNIPPQYLPQGFNQVQASVGQFLDKYMALAGGQS
jgi:hypothetical protein